MSPLTPRRLQHALARRRRRTARLAERRSDLLPHYVFAGHGRRRLNVTLVLRSAKRPTSSTYIRLLSPMSRPAFGRVGLDVVDHKDLWISRRSDVCIVQRTAFDDPVTAQRFVDEARRRECVVVVDSDDAFSTLDPDHPQYDQQIARAGVLEDVMRRADEVWLSTDDLLRAHDLPNARVVRNTLDLALWRPADEPATAPDPDAPLRMLYMGTTTHDGDLAMLAPVLERLHASRPGAFGVVMVGVAKGLVERPWMHVVKPPSSSYHRFVPWLVEQGPFDVGLSPLLDSPFNRAKSDIKCLDYLALGARPVVSDVEPYRVAELDGFVDRVPEDPQAWLATLERLVDDRARLRRDAVRDRRAGRDYLAATRSADLTATILRSRLDALVADRGTPSPRT
ncbi:hypothetical protein [Aeromicrobium sp. CFBP 8757]|uniref:hypothetical protein n=1 Tax=Aeromicrobium sp. CFBP 8757 TaxID=2775288 RepID=UPI001FCE3F10|nr:hypothetical protein [Aeromicrobium sp. CFBP 8757]